MDVYLADKPIKNEEADSAAIENQNVNYKNFQNQIYSNKICFNF